MPEPGALRRRRTATTRRRIALADLPRDAHGYVLSAEERASIRRPRRSTPTARARPTPSTASARISAEIEVDAALGTVRVLKITAAHDVGRAINPTLVEGQIEGGVAQGLGLALMEEFHPGRGENLHDYLIPTIGDVPADRVDPGRGPVLGRARSAPRASASRP